MNPKEPQHIGDGVYVCVEGGMLKLTTDRANGQDVIYLEHGVMDALKRYELAVIEYYKTREEPDHE